MINTLSKTQTSSCFRCYHSILFSVELAKQANISYFLSFPSSSQTQSLNMSCGSTLFTMGFSASPLQCKTASSIEATLRDLIHLRHIQFGQCKPLKTNQLILCIGIVKNFCTLKLSAMKKEKSMNCWWKISIIIIFQLKRHLSYVQSKYSEEL